MLLVEHGAGTRSIGRWCRSHPSAELEDSHRYEGVDDTFV